MLLSCSCEIHDCAITTIVIIINLIFFSAFVSYHDNNDELVLCIVSNYRVRLFRNISVLAAIIQTKDIICSSICKLH